MQNIRKNKTNANSPARSSHFSNNRMSSETEADIKELAWALLYCIRTSEGLRLSLWCSVAYSVLVTDKTTYWTCQEGKTCPESLLTAPLHSFAKSIVKEHDFLAADVLVSASPRVCGDRGVAHQNTIKAQTIWQRVRAQTGAVSSASDLWECQDLLSNYWGHQTGKTFHHIIKPLGLSPWNGKFWDRSSNH